MNSFGRKLVITVERTHSEQVEWDRRNAKMKRGRRKKVCTATLAVLEVWDRMRAEERAEEREEERKRATEKAPVKVKAEAEESVKDGDKESFLI